jgi:phosphoglycolate phosphatase-like HAD superfamily hydrolase
VDAPPTWVFDVDGCLVDALTGSSLRPGAVEVLEHLTASGHRILLWSAGGAGYARDRAVQHGIASFFQDFHGKDERDSDGCYQTGALGDLLDRLVFVDDHTEDIPPRAQRISVGSYLRDNPYDIGLAGVLANKYPDMR